MLDLVQPVWASGRVDTVLRWMEWLEAEGKVERYPELAVHGALTFALLGRPGEAERWVVAAERGSPAGTVADGSTLESVLAYMRALLCRNGVDEMRRDAGASLQGLSPSSPYRATMVHTEAVAHLLEGEPAKADPILARAFDDSVRAGALPLAAVVLAERGIVAIERDHWHDAEVLAERARSLLEDGSFDDYWTSALVYAWLARVAVRQGDVGVAQTYVGRAARLRPLLTYVLPVVSVQALLELARVYVSLADPGGAQAVLRQVNDIFQHRPDLGVLVQQANDLRATIETFKGAAVGASSLTAAELRLLPLLSTHLSLGEIGERLFVSRNTVKTQAVSIYRKLGVSSRSAAIARMNELGLYAGSLAEDARS